MIDMEQTVYDILTTTLTGMKWSVGFPQDFRALGDGLGSIKQADNSVRTSTSSGVDRISNVAVQVQTWTSTPERRNEFDRAIDAALATLGLPRSTLNHLEEILPGEIPAYRSVLLYSGAYDNVTKQFYIKYFVRTRKTLWNSALPRIS